MKYVLFTDPDKAYRHRAVWGGWLAHASDGSWHWFSMAYTPSKVILSPQLKGLSAKLH